MDRTQLEARAIEQILLDMEHIGEDLDGLEQGVKALTDAELLEFLGE